jgi:Tol biopolymer transport system component
VSADGGFVAFTSEATNLVPGDTNQQSDVFVYPRQSGVIEWISVGSSGAPGNGASYAPSLSADGRFVAFQSLASNLVAADTNAKGDVFVRDRQNGTLELVSVDASGAQGDGNSFAPAISGDGRFVAFNSRATNLVAGDTNGLIDTFVHDRQSGATERVSVATGAGQASGVQLNNPTYPYVAISGDGRFVAFWSNAPNLVAGDTNTRLDIFVRDRASATTERVSVDSFGTEALGESRNPSISADGRFVAFVSVASNLVAGDTNTRDDVFVRDRTNGTTERVSVSTGGAQTNNLTPGQSAWDCAISANGHYVSFGSSATNLVAGDSNSYNDIFVHDRTNGVTERVSVDSVGGQANFSSYHSSISGDGRVVAFSSEASNLVLADHNGRTDIFARERAPMPPSAYCTSGTTTNGCSASISATASPSVSFANPCNLAVTGVEGLKFGLLFYGTDNAGFVPAIWAPGSTSLRCVRYPVQRTSLQNSGGTFAACNGAYSLDWNSYQSAHPFALGNPWSSGAKVYAQAWFRDPSAVKSTNLSNAIELTYVP